ncbi:hypothetical protein C0J52_00217 [Blattella germanica]|nr:hypothetical protein C0J52_00217 [Blattella germanica]
MNSFSTFTPSSTSYYGHTGEFGTTHKAPYEYKEKIFGDFTAFYVTITICTVLGGFLFLLNIVLCCCSRYKHYWQDSNTGNRWILPIWTKTPHKQPPLDYSELENCPVPPPQQVFDTADAPLEYIELTHKKESDL